MNKTLVNVFRAVDFADCTANGLSSKVASGYLFWNCSREEAIEWCNKSGVNPRFQFIIKERELWDEDHSYAEPLDINYWNKRNGCQQFGGNFIYTSNSNCFKYRRETVNRPIKVHDRFEVQYNDYD
jgi:hypothetical protein